MGGEKGAYVEISAAVYGSVVVAATERVVLCVCDWVFGLDIGGDWGWGLGLDEMNVQSIQPSMVEIADGDGAAVTGCMNSSSSGMPLRMPQQHAIVNFASQVSSVTGVLRGESGYGHGVLGILYGFRLRSLLGFSLLGVS